MPIIGGRMAYRSITSLELGNSRRRRGRRIKKSKQGICPSTSTFRIHIQPGFNTVLSACRPPRPDLEHDSRVVVKDHDVVADISVATMRVASLASQQSHLPIDCRGGG
jgi:hypothetical protein